jgi:hypothetical protein
LDDKSDFPKLFATTVPFVSSRRNFVPDVGFEIHRAVIIQGGLSSGI